MTRIAALILLLIVPAFTSNADEVLFDNNAAVNTAFNADEGSSDQILADNFSLGKDSVIEQISWTGVYGNFVSNDSFTIDLFEDNACLLYTSDAADEG